MTGGSQLLILTNRNYPSDWQAEMFRFEDYIGVEIASWADVGWMESARSLLQVYVGGL